VIENPHVRIDTHCALEPRGGITDLGASNRAATWVYTFDGFGNLTDKTPTAGSPPPLSLPVNTATNQPIRPEKLRTLMNWGQSGLLARPQSLPILPLNRT
jgi:hypothetical protein